MLYSHYSSYPIVRSSNKSHFIDNKLRLRDIKNCMTSKRSQNSMPMAMLLSIITLSCLVTSFSLALLMRSTMIYKMTSLIGSRLNQRYNLLAPITRKESWYQARRGTRISGIFFLYPAFVLGPILFAAFSSLRFTVFTACGKRNGRCS